MTTVQVSPEVVVADFEAAVDWYGRFFGRPPDVRPMDGLVECQLTESAGFQVFHDAARAGAGHVAFTVDDVDAHVVELEGRDVSVEIPTDTPSGQFRLAMLEDPEGNRLVLVQALGSG